MCVTWVSHSCVWHEWVMSHITWHEWVMSHIWMHQVALSHVASLTDTHMWHDYSYVTYMRHMWLIWDIWVVMSHMSISSVGENSQQIWVLPGESDRYRTRQVVIILVRWTQIQLEFVRCVATHRTNTLPAILCQRAPVQIQTSSESPGATLPFPLRVSRISSHMWHDYS